MFSNEELVYEYVRRYNGIVSNKSNDFLVIDIIAALNRAYRSVVKRCIKDEDQSRDIRNDLRHLLVTHDPETPGNFKKLDGNRIEIIAPDNFYAASRAIVRAEHECCPGIVKDIEVNILQTNEISPARKNPYRRADFRWCQLPGDESKDGLMVYVDCAMEVKEVFLDYYRKVTPIPAPDLNQCKEGKYENWSKKFETNEDDFIQCDTYLFDEIVDEAVFQTAIASRDYTFGSQKSGEITFNRQI